MTINDKYEVYDLMYNQGKKKYKKIEELDNHVTKIFIIIFSISSIAFLVLTAFEISDIFLYICAGLLLIVALAYMAIDEVIGAWKIKVLDLQFEILDCQTRVLDSKEIKK